MLERRPTNVSRWIGKDSFDNPTLIFSRDGCTAATKPFTKPFALDSFGPHRLQAFAMQRPLALSSRIIRLQLKPSSCRTDQHYNCLLV
jgi:hypothetical protein